MRIVKLRIYHSAHNQPFTQYILQWQSNKIISSTQWVSKINTKLQHKPLATGKEQLFNVMGNCLQLKFGRWRERELESHTIASPQLAKGRYSLPKQAALNPKYEVCFFPGAQWPKSIYLCALDSPLQKQTRDCPSFIFGATTECSLRWM